MKLSEAEVEALLGPRPRSRTREYFRWRYRRMRLTQPDKYEQYLATKRGQPNAH